MTNEFKIKKFKNATVYTLESASAGGTSAGAVASVNSPMGKVHRRGDNLIAQEGDTIKVPVTQKPRQGPLRPQTGGGAHRDKKKEQKQGKEKHKKPFMEDEHEDREMLRRHNEQAFFAGHRQDRSAWKKHIEAAKHYADKLGLKYEVTGYGLEQDGELLPVNEGGNISGGVELSPEDRLRMMNPQQLEKILTMWEKKAKENPSPEVMAKAIPQIELIKKVLYNENNVEEDHEVSMASNELKSIYSDAKKLLMLVQRYGEQGDLEAWQQSKITKAADYLNSVLQSIGGEQGVAEDHNKETLKLHMKKYNELGTVPMFQFKTKDEKYKHSMQGADYANFLRNANVGTPPADIMGKWSKGFLSAFQNEWGAPDKNIDQAFQIIRSREQGVAEGMFDAFKPIPTEPETVKLGKFEVNLIPNQDRGYIGFSWRDSQGKENYTETGIRDLKNRRQLMSIIKGEILYVEKQINQQGVAEGMTRRGFLHGLGAAAVGAGLGAVGAPAQARATPEWTLIKNKAKQELQSNPNLSSKQIAFKLGIKDPEPKHKVAGTMLGAWGAIYSAMEEMDLPIKESPAESIESVDRILSNIEKEIYKQGLKGEDALHALRVKILDLALNQVGRDKRKGYEPHVMNVNNYDDAKEFLTTAFRDASENEDHSTASNGWGKGSYDAYAGTRHGRGVAEDEYFTHLENLLNEDWQKVNRRDKTDGMSRKAVKAYRRENPGSKLKTAVTTKPSKLKKGGKAAKRRKSFCARMSGMKKAHASAKTKRNPDSPINKALRRWNCEEDAYMNSLNTQMLEKLNPQAPVDVWVKDFQKADPNKYKQFKNKTLQKKAEMAVAAHYAANEPSKKK